MAVDLLSPFLHQVLPLVPALWPHYPGDDIRLWSSWADNGTECPKRPEVLGEAEGGKSQAAMSQRLQGWSRDSQHQNKPLKRQMERPEDCRECGVWGRQQMQGGEERMSSVDRKADESDFRPEGGLNPPMFWGQISQWGSLSRSPGNQALGFQFILY